LLTAYFADVGETVRPSPTSLDIVGGITRCVKSRRHVVCGLGLALGAAVCWAGTLVSIRRSLHARPFYAPFFVTYFSTLLTLLVYPVYVVCQLVADRSNVSVRDIR